MDTNDTPSPQQPIGSDAGPDGGGIQPDQTPTERAAVGQRLRSARETLGLTQDDVAGAMGMPRTSVIAMESGKRNVTAVELRRLARLYRRNVQWLLGEEDDAAAVDTALYRATQDLSENDKAQVLRFAQFLAAGGTPPPSGRRRTAPPTFGTRPRPADPAQT